MDKYRLLFYEARDGLGLVDGPTGHIIEANDEFLRQAGRERTALRALRFWQLSAGEFVDVERRRLGAAA